MVYVDRAHDGYANVYTSRHAESLSGYTPEEWMSDPSMLQRLLHPEDAEVAKLATATDRAELEYRLMAKDGREVWVRDTFRTVTGQNGEPLYVQGVIQDITDRKRVEEQARASERRFREILEEMHLLALTVDEDGKIVFCNDYTLELTGWTREELLGRRLSETLIAPAERVEGRRRFLEAMQTGDLVRHGETRVVTRAGEERIVSYNSTLMLTEDGEPAGMTTIAEDITERRLAEDEMHRLSYYDGLTGLPNRSLFADWLELALTCAREHTRTVAVVYVSLDDFSLVNEALDHAAGDALLAQFADRLREAAASAELVARQGGDEFLVLLADVDPETGAASTHAVAADVAQIAAAFEAGLNRRLQQPFEWQGHEIYLTASVGTALFPDDAEDADTLIKQALLSRYRTRETGRRPASHPGLRTPVQELELIAALHRAIERSEFHLNYQPVIDLLDGRAVGVEALLRWTSPTLGPVSPAVFVPVAERTGLIEPITEWVVDSVCSQSISWQEMGIDLEIAFNFPTTLWTTSWVESVLATVRSHGLQAGRLAMEVTETTAMSAEAETESITAILSDAGLPLAIDDFGTGYSSLSRLKALHASTLKVDRTFVRDLPGDAGSAAMVTTIIQLARNLGLVPLAEGIETEAQRQFLVEHGCTIGQGFLFSPAVSPEEIERRWRDDRRGDVAA